MLEYTPCRSVRALLLREQYEQVLGKADSIYLTEDTARTPMGLYLLEAACCAIRPFEERTLTMVKPGFAALRYNSEGRPELQQLLSVLPAMEKADESGFSYGHLRILNSSARIRRYQETEQDLIVDALRHQSGAGYHVVISQDKLYLKLLRSLYARRESARDSKLLTLSMDERGLLRDPFVLQKSTDDELTRQAAQKLSLLVEKRRLYMDDSALKHPQAELFLRNIKPILLLRGFQLGILAHKSEPVALAELLLARAQEEQSTVRFLWLDEELNKPDAITKALRAEGEKPGDMALISNRLSRIALLERNLRRSGTPISFYSINRHGFLSNRDTQLQEKEAFVDGMDAPGNKRPDIEAELRQATILINQAQMKQAVENNDCTWVSKLAVNPAALETGIHTALCHNNAGALEALIATADNIPARSIRWWILESKMFRQPRYLSEHPHFYTLLVKALPKVEFSFGLAAKIIRHLQELDAQQEASHRELQFLISLFREAIDSHQDDAPVIRISASQIPATLPHSDSEKMLQLQRELQKLLYESKHLETLILELTRTLKESTAQLDDVKWRTEEIQTAIESEKRRA